MDIILDWLPRPPGRPHPYQKQQHRRLNAQRAREASGAPLGQPPTSLDVGPVWLVDDDHHHHHHPATTKTISPLYLNEFPFPSRQTRRRNKQIAHANCRPLEAGGPIDSPAQRRSSGTSPSHPMSPCPAERAGGHLFQLIGRAARAGSWSASKSTAQHKVQHSAVLFSTASRPSGSRFGQSSPVIRGPFEVEPYQRAELPDQCLRLAAPQAASALVVVVVCQMGAHQLK